MINSLKLSFVRSYNKRIIINNELLRQITTRSKSVMFTLQDARLQKNANTVDLALFYQKITDPTNHTKRLL